MGDRDKLNRLAAWMVEDLFATPDEEILEESVFSRPDCVFNYCPHPMLCTGSCQNERSTYATGSDETFRKLYMAEFPPPKIGDIIKTRNGIEVVTEQGTRPANHDERRAYRERDSDTHP